VLEDAAIIIRMLISLCCILSGVTNGAATSIILSVSRQL
jgi:hypothetical protein